MTWSPVRTSKFLSRVLRHRPESIGLSLDSGGWAEVDALIDCSAAHGVDLTREGIAAVVAASDKQRFALSADGTRIRANQGHSFPVDLDLAPLQPPERLYHGTASRFLDSIFKSGLQPQGRQHVHLSADTRTATTVGRRHGSPVVLAVDAGRMHREGRRFFRSANGVWLCERVPSEFLSVVPDTP
jgi:putative RNA 2'-phosphotransferase